ncbi:MAG: nitroreductase family protein [Candidatus Omnitrophota bacterium]|nr:nitroreductase family protein [Candidatus Omnitrophota bacterium]
MDILKLIKKRCTTRIYLNKKIPHKIINKIIEAGVWGPSIHGFQPWKFIIVQNRKIINRFSKTILSKTQITETYANTLMTITARTIKNAGTIIAIYNSRNFTNFAHQFKKRNYTKISELSEVEAISAAIQNMLLTAETLRVGSCWTIVPLFYEQEINRILDTKDRLLAIVTLGFPAEKGRRTKRKPNNIVTKYIA